MNLEGKDIIVQEVWADHQQRSSRVPVVKAGIRIYHKLTGDEVTITHSKSIHINKAIAISVLSVCITTEEEYCEMSTEQTAYYNIWWKYKDAQEELVEAEKALEVLRKNINNIWEK